MMRTGLALLVMASLSACESPYVYQKEISSFSASVATVTGAITQGLVDIDEDQRAADLAVVVATRTGVRFSLCDKPRITRPDGMSEPCRILPKGEGEQGLPLVRAQFSKAEPDLRRDLGILKTYADGLAAVANAQDRKDYDAAAAQLASSLGALPSTVPIPAAPAVGVALTAFVKFTTWTIGQSLDQARFKTLRSALNAVGDPLEGSTESPIRIVADNVVRNTLAAIQVARAALLGYELDARGDWINNNLGQARLSDERYAQLVTGLDPEVAKLDAVLAIVPADVANKLVEAHDKLKNAVNDPQTQNAAIIQSIIEFAEQADALKKALTRKPTAT